VTQVKTTASPWIFVGLTALFLIASGFGNARANTPGSSGGEIWVDGPASVQPSNNRNFPDVAIDTQGNAVFVWSTGDIYLRRFDEDGNPLEDPVQINTTTLNDQRRPRIAMQPDGSFLVAWQSNEPEPIYNGGAYPYVRTQAFDADAKPVGTEQLMYTTSTGALTERHVDVAALTGGGYVVVWAQELPVAPETGRSIMARRVTANGTPDGDAFVVNSTIGQSELDPTVTELDDGGFLVAWDLFPNIAGRRFDANGTPLTLDFQLTVPVLSNRKSDPDISRGVDGRILLVWQESERISGGEIRGRMFTPNLSPLGDDFRINTVTDGGQSRARAAPYGQFGFIVVWEDPVGVGSDPDTSIQGKVVSSNAVFGSSQFQVNAFTTGGQYSPAVGGRNVDGRGGVVGITWGSQFNAENGGASVITGRFWTQCEVFCDGFEQP
jgi:hypothetical protein